MLRNAGSLARLDTLEPRDHVCWVVDSDAGYDDLVTACLDAGARSGDKLFLFGPQPSGAPLAERERVQVLDPRVAFLDGGELDPDVMLQMFGEQAARARDEGFRGVRVIADMDWLLACPPGADHLMSFELRLDEVVADIGATVVCAYRTTTTDTTRLSRVVGVHPLDLGGKQADPGFRIWSTALHCWKITGEIDFANVDAFSVALTAAAPAEADVRFDLEGLSFVDLAGMRAFVEVARTRNDRRLVIESAPPIFRRCWSLLGYDDAVAAVEFSR